MHISDLHIDRFGIWRDLTLPLGGQGLNVLYGPNEAGKSTLMRFIKAVLYGGVPPRAEADPPRSTEDRVVASGSLRLVCDGTPYTVRRQLTAMGGGHVQLVGPDDSPLPPGKLDELLSGTSEAVFDRVFAVDLYELQELATLDHEDLAGHVYGLSLGGRGRKLLAAVDDLRQKREAVLSSDGRSGRLARLLDQERDLLAQIRALPDLPSLQADLFRQRDGIDSEVAALKRRRGDLQHELRGRKFLDRVHPAWKQVAQYQSQLAKLPAALDLPPDGLKQLADLEREGESLARRRDERKRHAAEAKRKAETLGPVPEIARAEPAVRAMLGLRDWIKETTAARQSAAEAKGKAAEAAKRARDKLGPEWTDAKIAAVNTTPQAQLELAKAARDYRTALGRRADLRRKYRALRDSAAKREADLQEKLARLGRSPDAAVAELRRRIAAAEQLAELRAKEAAYEHRGKALRQRLEQLVETLDVPPWVSIVLAMFALGGAVFAIMGLVTGVSTSAIAGSAYLLLGVTAGSIAVKLRSHFEVALKETAERVRDERRAEEAELRKVREEIARLNGGTGPAPAARPKPDQDRQIIPLSAARRAAPVATADTLREFIEEFADLDDIVAEQDRVKARRKRLTQLRARLRKVQQTVEAARQAWCQTLVRIGLAETLEIEASLVLWQQIAEAAAARAAVGLAEREHALLDRALRTIGSQIEAMGRRIKAGADAAKPLETLAGWEKELDAALRKAAERKKHVEEHKKAKRDAAEAAARLKELARQRTALLAAAGVKSRADYERRLKAAEQRHELEELLALAESELESLAAAEPELAIVEDDLRSFRPAESAAALQRLLKEQEETEAKLESAHERRGRLARRLDELEVDDRPAALRRQKAALDADLKRAGEELLALTLAEQAAEQARAAYEQNRQPAVLGAASEALTRLTRNRYVRIWSPLGERTLRVDDDHGRTFAVEQLSGGTREQLFLALRLGLVRHAAERGVRLPVVLDDVFVNFDQLRTEAAFETIREFAGENRQVLFFTCHLHLAHMAEQRGIDPIWLPGHQPPMQQRLAG
jgi:uncharacterized protein YhaN